ncbi:MAG TPA: EAL domain-containing protein [Dokdonella sp.]|uniref:EAL domain-containing protein n=2 Tax=Dokdonella sp. TaxID=2291710 RepID=UPI002BAFCEC1|nr:EAL domain-containing protein [Dokdonella sp.]HPG95134.1 EAL domain-containing protein [Dokdonella sp.]HPN80732.1 EAL domain-containing protein [Dokdonella sp.]
MTGTQSNQGLSDATAREALRERCLSLVRRWQPLARSGWDHQAARLLGEELDQIAQTSETLGLQTVNGSALELAAYLCSFIDDKLVPNENALECLAGMVNTLGGALSELSGSATAAVHSLHGAGSDEPEPAAVASDPIEAKQEVDRNPTWLPRATCLLGDTVRNAPGLAAALRERGYQVNEFDDIDGLLEFLTVARPGALLLDARALSHLGRIRARLDEGNAGELIAQPALLVFSRNGDLGDRLLAMRAGAAGLFSMPLDSLRVIASLDELLVHATQTPWRVLLAEADRVAASERARWLAERGMTVRLAANGQAALAALPEFRPDVLVVDQELSDVHGLELIQLVREQPEHAALPIVLMSANGDIGQRFDAIAAGSDEVLLKPVKARHLTHALLSRLNRSRRLREMIGNTGGRDPRTGLYSRAVLLDKLATASGDRSAALMCIAIDRSQTLRESIGISGLAALDAHIGQLLRSQLDVADIAAHYQDFHYFVLVHRRSRGEVTTVAEDIRDQLTRQGWLHNGKDHALTASVGLALLGGEPTGIDAMVTNAEAAQIAAAHMGGNRVLWYEAREAALLPSDPLLAVRAVMGRPLKAEQATFDFLPIVPLVGKLSGQFDLRFRVLSTQNPGSSISYDELAPAAAETNQLAAIDRLLLQHTLEMRGEQLKRGRQLRIFVQQSVASLLSADLCWWLDRELKAHHLSGTGLTLNLPCSPLIDAGERGRERIAELRKLGIRVCLNDFGRDWAAVHALKQLQADFVRLDPTLVHELGSVRSIADTVLALVRKAHAAGAAVIAPETDNITRAHLLLRLGVDYALGPAFSQPLSQPDFDFTRPLY